MSRDKLIHIILIGLVGTFTAVAIMGCSSANTTGGGTNGSGGMMRNGGSQGSGGQSNLGPGGSTMGGGRGTGSYSSVGERIFLTGIGGSGQEISHTAPRVSQGALMMGGGGCGSCHAADGKGGTISMMMGPTIKAPDITYDALITAGFTDATIRRAIVSGLDESGASLNAAMPRWRMNATDLDATIAYLKELSAK